MYTYNLGNVQLDKSKGRSRLFTGFALLYVGAKNMTKIMRQPLHHVRKKRYFVPYDSLNRDPDYRENNYDVDEVERKVSYAGSVSMIQELEMEDIELVASESFEKPILPESEDTPVFSHKKDNVRERSFKEAYDMEYLTEIQAKILSKWLFVQRLKKSVCYSLLSDQGLIRAYPACLNSIGVIKPSAW